MGCPGWNVKYARYALRWNAINDPTDYYFVPVVERNVFRKLGAF